MKIIRVKILEAASCGGLLDGLDIELLRPKDVDKSSRFLPICLIGKNGTGKSQFLQLLAEIFQAAWHQFSPTEERSPGNTELLFEIIYEIALKNSSGSQRVRLSRRRTSSGRIGSILMEVRRGEDYEAVLSSQDSEFGQYLPSSVVAYTSGDNETLSVPFYLSRSAYAAAVAKAAKNGLKNTVPDNRLVLLDYSTNLEVLIANLMIGDSKLHETLISHANLSGLHSFRLVIQLNHPSAPKANIKNRARKGIQLTDELEETIRKLCRSATCWDYDPKQEIYVIDYLVCDEICKAFSALFVSAVSLYRSLHKLAMLNDLMIPKKSRDRLLKNIQTRRFASKLPEAQDEAKVFRIQEVRFHKDRQSSVTSDVDYVSLSDGEHQQAQLLGIISMFRERNTLFLLDEPESHFNPQWRATLVTRLSNLPVKGMDEQEFILTTHAPFVPSDMYREQIRIFTKKDELITVCKPSIETFGADYDAILSHCFDIDPPIGQLAQDKINQLKSSSSPEEIEKAMRNLGSSVEKALLADRVFELREKS